MFVPHFLPSGIPIYDLLLAGLIVMRVSLPPSVSCFPPGFGPAIPTRVSNIDCLVPFHELVAQLPQFHSLDALVDGLADGVPVLVHKRWSPSAVHHVGVDEGAQHTFFTSSKC